ncbi:DUF2713 family protein [Shigella flexneri]
MGSGFLTFVNACQEHDDNSLRLFASLLISIHILVPTQI